MTYFVTGATGFIGRRLVKKLLARRGTVVYFLVRAESRDKVPALLEDWGVGEDRAIPVVGDLGQPLLGLSKADQKKLTGKVKHFFHLAAVYDLSVSRDLGMRVNVDGTRHVLEFAHRCPALRRLHYVSTCYISGRYDGVFTELMLEEGQQFNNWYEETKYLAEVLVQRASRGGLPVSIYRPAVVVGDSTTGMTQKFDGPYFVMQWLLRQPRIALMPVVGNPLVCVLNVVPRDFVVDAIAYLSAHVAKDGMVYHLADPAPITVDAMLSELARSTKRIVLRVPLPMGVAKFAIEHVPGVYRTLRIPSPVINYFNHRTTYTTTATEAALTGSGIRCPRFPEYVDRLVQFARDHPEIRPTAMF